jgi:signal transduction histidine kinase
MIPEERLQISRVLQARRDEIAEQWFAVISRTGFASLTRGNARHRFRALTEQAIAVLLSEPFDHGQAAEIGATLADLHFVQPEALGGTQEVLARELVVGLSPPQLVPLQPRLAQLLGEIAAGFYERARAMILEEQEQIRRALFVARMHAEEARAATEAALQVRNTFLSAVSHDLRVPLTTISGRAQFLQLQLSSLPEPERSRLTGQLASIVTSATKMGRMIDDLLDLTRLQAGEHIQLNREETDLVALAGEVVGEYQLTTPRHHLSVEAMAPSIVGLWDRNRVERVIGNLLSNAIKYSPRGGDIAVVVREQGGSAVVEVRDQGQGIPAADLPHLFDWYRRAQNVGKTAGMGIGLAVVRQVVEQHGGTVSVRSRPGAGTTVSFSLPLEALDKQHNQEAVNRVGE